MRSLLITLVCAVVPAAFAQNVTEPASLTADLPEPQTARKWSGQWNLNMGGISFQEGKDEGAAAFAWFSTGFKYNFTRWLKGEISPNLSLYSSRVQERYDDDTFQNRIWMMDAHLSFEPIEYFELRAGALNQGFLGSSMLVSSLRSFPGIQEIVKFKGEQAELKIIVQQAVPTSHTLNTERATQEELPMFSTQTFTAKGKHFNLIEWKSTGGLFKWSSLPSKVISDSRLSGAMGTGIEVTDSRFTYEHQGWFGTAELCLCMDSKIDVIGEIQRIHNTKADSFAADAQSLGIGGRVRFGDRELDLRYRQFFIESDATVAAYNKSSYGHTNRTGDGLEASLAFKKDHFKIYARGFRASPINVSEAQRDMSIYYLGVETDDASF
jgi:hypothetical protein